MNPIALSIARAAARSGPSVRAAECRLAGSDGLSYGWLGSGIGADLGSDRTERQCIREARTGQRAQAVPGVGRRRPAERRVDADRDIRRGERVAHLVVGPRLGEHDPADRASSSTNGPPLSPRSIAARSSRISRLTFDSAVDVAARGVVRAGDGRRHDLEVATARVPERRAHGAPERVVRREDRSAWAPRPGTRRTATSSSGSNSTGRASGRRPGRRDADFTCRPAPATTCAFVTTYSRPRPRSRSRSTRTRRRPPRP